MGCVFQFFLTVIFFSVSEVTILLWVAQNTGLIFTMACCVITGVLGGYFVKQQGLQTLDKIRQSLESGVVPADEAIEALMLLIVGVLLCVPGFITDFLGFMIIIPFIRKPIASMLVNHFKSMVLSGNVKFSFSGQTMNPNQHTNQPENNYSSTPSEPGKIEDAEIVDDKTD